MSHNLNISRIGQYAFASRKPAWHQLGQITGEFMTWADIAEKAQLDFKVEKHALLNPFTMQPDGFGVFRMDTRQCLGQVGERYEPIQHQRGFELLDQIIGFQNGAHYEAAGALGKGEKVWGLVDINRAIQIKGTDDKSENFLLFSTSHDGSASFSVRITSTRVVCQNTLNLALSQKTQRKFSVSHRKNAIARVDAAANTFQDVVSNIEQLEERLNFLATKRINKESFLSVIDRLFPSKEDQVRSSKAQNQVAELVRLFESNDNNAIPALRGTALNLLNATTEYCDHFRGTKTTGDMTQKMARSRSSMFGSGDQFKNHAMQVIMESAESLPLAYNNVGNSYSSPVAVMVKTTPKDNAIDRVLSMVEI
ncbi:DUF932 domain-containing protein [Acanthopleuribacter pedis]|uniref:DUF932 domain-containing protein n=1 Tax=Acanthopleuribacter pedis TaxID=442870 RepID=A0A8J7QLN2_9BACT|nr:DUF932 domain-containing protein [Acanthopleuribacter pedis]MBO1323456.1 DUF932 domain-containing protein [Acanthopleuribacter pedis]